MTKFKKISIVTVLGLLVSACASNVTVVSNVPQPLVEQLPLVVKLELSPEFSNYIYTEENNRRSIKSMELGAAQSDAFRKIFSAAMLADTTRPPDLLVQPSLIKVQYSSPRETSLNVYEVFLRYRVKINDRDGNNLADWVIKGYGKTPTVKLRTPSAAFELAAQVALRDVGAQILVGLPKQQLIQDLVAAKTRSSVADQEESL